MSENANNVNSRDPASLVGELVPRAPLVMPRRYNLASLRGCRQEMAYIYKQTRDGVIETERGSRLVYMLSQIGRLIEVAELEARLRKLEALNNERRTGTSHCKA